ncbi:MAG: hypothetical protein M3285_04740 [Actinomycetota bacterium]|nr:hypothetical protein [Actinomycetota bacterium]
MSDYDPTRPFDPSEPDPGLDWEEDDGSPKLLWGRVLALAGVLLLAFLIGRMSAPDDSAEQVQNLQERLAAANARITELEDKVLIDDTPTETPPETPPDSPDDPPESPPPGEGDEGEDGEGTVETYTVESGDNYTSISEDLFGDPAGAECISDANDNAPLQPGQEINVPDTCDPDA